MVNLVARVYFNKHKDWFEFSAIIVFKQNDINLFVNLAEQSAVARERLLKAYSTPIKRNDIKIMEARVGDNEISLYKPNEDIQFTNGVRQNGMNIVSMPINSLKFTFNDEIDSSIYRLSSVCAPRLYTPHELLVDERSTIVGIHPTTLHDRCFDIQFSLFRKGNYAYITTNRIERLLDIFSFYYGTYYEYDMVCYPLQDGKACIEIIVPKYKVISSQAALPVGYLLSNDICLGNFTDFLSGTQMCKLPSDELKLKSFIHGFVRAEYLDNISKLTIYTTILEKIVGVKINDDTYKCIKNYLAQRKISVHKIDDNISKAKLRNEDGDIISNFIQLRNFFIHHLGSAEAESYLTHSEMLFNLKLCITIILLNIMGFDNIAFRPDFIHLSLFDDSLKVGKCAKVRTKTSKICQWLQSLRQRFSFFPSNNHQV